MHARATPAEVAAAAYVPPARPLRRAQATSKPKPDPARERVSKVWAGMWCCGDEVCDCSQPQITVYEPNRAGAGYKVETLWCGTFESGATRAEAEAQERELADECARRGIAIGLTRLSEVDRDRLVVVQS